MLEVDPLQELPTTKPPDSATPWHISVAFYNPQRKQSFKAIERRYTQWREYTLIGWIQGASFYLDPQRCPVGSDPDLQALIRSDPWYGHKPIYLPVRCVEKCLGDFPRTGLFGFKQGLFGFKQGVFGFKQGLFGLGSGSAEVRHPSAHFVRANFFLR